MIGTAHSTFVVAADEEGRWVILTQAREDTNGDGWAHVTLGTHAFHGDRRVDYLISEGGGEGLALGQVLAVHARSGRAVSYDAGTVSLLDAYTGERERLTTAEDTTYVPIASFDADGVNLLYGTFGASGLALRHRALSSGRDVAVDVPRGRVVHAELDVGGRYALAVRRRDGALAPPRLSPGFAPARPPRFLGDEGWGDHDPPLDGLLVSLGGRGLPADVSDPNVLAVFGDALLVREPDGSLALVSPEGARTTLVPGTCRGVPLRAWPPQGTLLVRCEREGSEPTLERFAVDGTHVVLPLLPGPTPRRLAVPIGRVHHVGHARVDLETVAVEETDPTRPLLASWGTRRLERRGERLQWRDLASGEERDLGRSAPRSWPLLRAGRFVQVGEETIDLEQGLLVSRRERPLAIDSRGRRLVPLGGWEPEVACGPLVWRAFGEPASSARGSCRARPNPPPDPFDAR